MKTVAVIGAGASGLTAIKCCLDEGLEPTCFERTSNIGGLWCYTDDVKEGQASVMKSTVISTSKEMMCYSDFPIPKEFPIFMHNTYVLKYFQQYANKFGLGKHIQFETEVVNVYPIGGLEDSTKWKVDIRNIKTCTTETKIFEAVLVCTGHHSDKNMPAFPGIEHFKGKVIHSRDYKTWEDYKGKKVVVVGIGNSGCDAAEELCRFTSKIYLSTRRGSWVINRISSNGMPFDMIGRKRFNDFQRKIIPQNILSKRGEKRLNEGFDHSAYCLKPKHGPFQQHLTISDALPSLIANGSITIKPNNKRFTETGVVFEDGTSDEIDRVIFATGYIFGFPFIDKTLIKVKNNEVSLYKYMFPPETDIPTIAIIGCIQPVGALMPISELQCRLATRVFKGIVRLPSKDDRLKDIEKKRMDMARRYYGSKRHTIQVDFIDFMDQLAELNGCKPDFKSLFLTDPKLALQCFFGPCTPYQFRLHGPGKWSGARNAIMTQWDRTCFPLNTRPLGFQEKGDSKRLAYIGLVAICTCLIVFLFY